MGDRMGGGRNAPTRLRVSSVLVVWISLAASVEDSVQDHVQLAEDSAALDIESQGSGGSRLSPGEAVKQAEAELLVHTGGEGQKMQMLGYNEIFNLAYLHD